MLTILLVALAFFLVVRRLQRRDPTPALYNYRDATKNEIGEYDAKQRHWETEPKAELKIKVAKEGHAASPPVTCMEVFKKAVERHGNSDALAIERGGEGKWLRWTWKSYYEDTMAAARAFVALGVERFGCVNVIGFNSPEWFISNMGAIACGAKVAGIYTTNQPDACQYITEHSEAAVVVVENEAQMAKFLQIKNKLPKLRALVQWDGKMPDSSAQQGKVKVLDWASFIKLGRDEVKLQSEVEDRIAQTRPGHCSTLIYTSGTTGNPKAVMISHDNVTWTAKISLLTIDIVGTEQRSISYLPLSHIAAQMLDIHVPMAFAAHTDSNLCVCFARPDALKGSLGVTIKAVRPTQFFGVPRVWEKMEEKMRAVGASTKGIKKKMATWAKEVGVNGYKAGEVGASGLLPPMYSLAHKLVLSKIHDALGFDKCTCFFVGAAPTAKETFLYFGALGIPICELYGMSECTGPQTVSRVNYRKLGSCGASIPGTQLKLDHVDGRDKPGEGEICYRGRHIMMGYMKEPGKTQDAIDNEGWLHSGDVGRIDSNGLLYITGRIKELLITAGGENIAPVPVEETLRKELPGISNCMLVGDRRKFNSMLVTLRTEPDLETGGFKDNLVGEAANVSASKTIQQAIKDPAWQKYVQAGVDRTNKQATSRACYIQKFAILPIDFSVPGGELTATLKLKRAAVCEKYKDLIESMYAGSAE